MEIIILYLKNAILINVTIFTSTIQNKIKNSNVPNVMDKIDSEIYL